MENDRKDSSVIKSTEMGINDEKKYEPKPGSAGVITPDKYGEDKKKVPTVEVDSKQGQSLANDPVRAVDEKGRTVGERQEIE